MPAPNAVAIQKHRLVLHLNNHTQTLARYARGSLSRGVLDYRNVADPVNSTFAKERQQG